MTDGEPGFAYGASVLFPLFLRETGELVDSDPRLFPDALVARGVELQGFALI